MEESFQYLIKEINYEEFDKINVNNFEDLLNRAIARGCFVKVNSLIHNGIEHYLKFKIIKFMEKNYIMFCNEKNKKITEKEIREFEEKVEILNNSNNSEYLKYLVNYLEICYMFNLIDKNMYNEIKKFNKKRNKITHSLLKGKHGFSDLIKNARDGRKLQLFLSPLEHSEKDIENILKSFDELVKKSKSIRIK